MSRVAVLTDSAASLPSELAAAHGVTVVPLQVIVDGVGYREGVDITSAEVVARLEEGSVVTTSQPSPEEFAAAIQAAADAGAAEAVIVTLSKDLSGTFSAAGTAAAAAPIPVEVVDSRTVAMGQGFAVLAAAQAAADGAPAAAVRDAAERTARGSTCVFTVDTLDYMRRGGRISPAIAAVGRVLGIRPVLHMVDGAVAMRGPVRSSARARAALADAARDALADLALRGLTGGVAVLSAGPASVPHAPESAAMTVEGDVSAALAAHTGPGTVAVCVAPWGVLGD
ncbi:DegV family protein [Demequina pelophila]|uniref:DegV family protein n=1 Tax=Demequina pelophila TaxID=1638984 RepID=UPI000784A759|nr:DegV family protein [Demequina pelophila]